MFQRKKENLADYWVFTFDWYFKVKHTSPEAISKEDNWCWEQSFIDVDIGAEDVSGIRFVQKGYWVNVISTHNVDAYVLQPDGSHIDLKIKVVFLH